MTEWRPRIFAFPASRHLTLGQCVSLSSAAGLQQIAEVVHIDETGATVKPFDANLKTGIGEVAWKHSNLALRPHRSWKGRVLNALGSPSTARARLLDGDRSYDFDAEPPSAMTRTRVRKPLKTGVRVVDLFTPICAGQRIGIFAGSGVGKSTLLSMLAKSTGFDTVVLSLGASAAVKSASSSKTP